MSMLKKICSVFVCVIILTLCAVAPVSAENMSVSLIFQCEKKPVAGCEFRLYKIMDSRGKPADEFADYAIDFDFGDSDTLASAAETLTYYIGRDKIKPDAAKKTNSDGYVRFDVYDEGIYLLTGDSVTIDGVTYTPESILFSMPSQGADGEEICNLELKPKYDKEQQKDKVNKKVLKTWKNDSGQARPDSITVELLCDGEVYDTVVLSADNLWRYEWTELDGGKRWTLTEKDVPEGYNVSISLEGITYHVVNKGSTPPPPPDEPTTEGDKDKEDIIPETGVLWWPVPYIACLGLLLVIIGYVRKQQEE